MGWQKREQRLDGLLADARAARPPELDVEALRERLLMEFRAAAASDALAPRGLRPRARLRPLTTVGWAMAAACVLAIGVVWQGVRAPAERADAVATRVSAPSATRNGESLALGELLSAGDAALRIEHAGQATWVLSPGSEARLLSALGGVLRVELARGTLDASVLPSERTESFVVQAGRTEVSVHGTRFQVSFQGERVGVVVTEGEVEVQPLGQARGTLLRAGMQAEFVDGVVQSDSLQVVPLDVVTAARQALAEPTSRPVPPAVTAARPRSSAPRAGKLEPEAPLVSAAPSAMVESSPRSEEAVTPEAPVQLLEAALKVASERIQRCFRQHTPARGELSIEAATQLGLWVQPNGLILEVGLEPPLAPPVEQCVAAELAGLNLGASPGGFRIDREIRLSR